MRETSPAGVKGGRSARLVSDARHLCGQAGDVPRPPFEDPARQGGDEPLSATSATRATIRARKRRMDSERDDAPNVVRRLHAAQERQPQRDLPALPRHASRPKIMGLGDPWHGDARGPRRRPTTPNGCLGCHAEQFRTVRHQTTYLKAANIEKLAKTSSDVCYGCHGGRAWYRIVLPLSAPSVAGHGGRRRTGPRTGRRSPTCATSSTRNDAQGCEDDRSMNARTPRTLARGFRLNARPPRGSERRGRARDGAGLRRAARREQHQRRPSPTSPIRATTNSRPWSRAARTIAARATCSSRTRRAT